MKVMALDFGEKRVGLASTDEGGSFALPRTVLANDASLLDQVLAFKMKEGIAKVVIGESKNLDGTPNPINAAAEQFGRALEERGVEVVFHPEVFTTQEAIRLQGENSMVDASAAALILKNYLDTQAAKCLQ
jgi:putative Holliday junction resolvase